MTDEAGFLRAIRENPADDGLRLVFADWLEERGDRRGGLLRLACSLRQAPAGDPLAAAVEPGLQEVLDAVDRTWGEPVTRPPRPPREAREYRGPVRPERTTDWSRL